MVTRCHRWGGWSKGALVHTELPVHFFAPFCDSRVTSSKKFETAFKKMKAVLQKSVLSPGWLVVDWAAGGQRRVDTCVTTRHGEGL